MAALLDLSRDQRLLLLALKPAARSHAIASSLTKRTRISTSPRIWQPWEPNILYSWIDIKISRHSVSIPTHALGCSGIFKVLTIALKEFTIEALMSPDIMDILSSLENYYYYAFPWYFQSWRYKLCISAYDALAVSLSNDMDGVNVFTLILVFPCLDDDDIPSKR